jgi:hypothetical protein
LLLPRFPAISAQSTKSTLAAAFRDLKTILGSGGRLTTELKSSYSIALFRVCGIYTKWFERAGRGGLNAEIRPDWTSALQDL